MTFDYEHGYRQACHDHLPEGMKHCTITFHKCAKGHGWLSAENWVQHGCPTCELDEVRTQSFVAYIDEEFQQNLKLAREELECVNEFSEDWAWKMAIEWTQDDIANQIGSYLSQKWWKKMDDINKV